MTLLTVGNWFNEFGNPTESSFQCYQAMTVLYIAIPGPVYYNYSEELMDANKNFVMPVSSMVYCGADYLPPYSNNKLALSRAHNPRTFQPL